MGPPRQRIALALALCLLPACAAWAGETALTPAEAQRVAARGIVIKAALDATQRRGTVRAAIRVDAPAHVVFRMMTRCEDAMQYVPHMRLCRVRDQAADNTWQLVEHEIDFGWYAPRSKYIVRADLVPDRRIYFHQVSGDFKAYQGTWELQPAEDGSHTLLLYRAYIDPPAFIPNWLARSSFRREMPQMLTDLRRRCEALSP
jgi:ribosome-associated toxin RatA of RatAB toxin-antitoxin module